VPGGKVSNARECVVVGATSMLIANVAGAQLGHANRCGVVMVNYPQIGVQEPLQQIDVQPGGPGLVVQARSVGCFSFRCGETGSSLNLSSLSAAGVSRFGEVDTEIPPVPEAGPFATCPAAMDDPMCGSTAGEGCGVLATAAENTNKRQQHRPICFISFPFSFERELSWVRISKNRPHLTFNLPIIRHVGVSHSS
jgi:hypothetical protein